MINTELYTFFFLLNNEAYTLAPFFFKQLKN